MAKTKTPAESRRRDAFGEDVYGYKTYDQSLRDSKPGIGNSEERVEEQKKFKMNKAKAKLQKKAYDRKKEK